MRRGRRVRGWPWGGRVPMPVDGPGRGVQAHLTSVLCPHLLSEGGPESGLAIHSHPPPLFPHRPSPGILCLKLWSQLVVPWSRDRR